MYYSVFMQHYHIFFFKYTEKYLFRECNVMPNSFKVFLLRIILSVWHTLSFIFKLDIILYDYLTVPNKVQKTITRLRKNF